MGTILDILTGFMVVMGCIFTGILIMACTKTGFRLELDKQLKEKEED